MRNNFEQKLQKRVTHTYFPSNTVLTYVLRFSRPINYSNRATIVTLHIPTCYHCVHDSYATHPDLSQFVHNCYATYSDLPHFIQINACALTSEKPHHITAKLATLAANFPMTNVNLPPVYPVCPLAFHDMLKSLCTP